MVNLSKHIIFMVISLLVAVLTYSSSSSVLAATKNPSPRDVCNVFNQGVCECTNDIETLSATCCVLQRNPGGGYVHVCQTCSINTDTGDYYNCSVYNKPTKGLANVPQGGGVIEQPPPTPKKHGGTIPPKGGGVLEQPSTDQGTIQSPPTNNNKPKGGDLLGQIGGEDLTATKKGSNNDNSPTPPACPDKGPIPPNCTLKPKF